MPVPVYKIYALKKITSLNFNLIEPSVDRMLIRRMNLRGLSRLMAGLFAVQIMVAGFCLLTADAHAISMHQMMPEQAEQLAEDMAEHCSKSLAGSDQHHADSCFHCDDPDMFVKAAPVDLPGFDPVLSFVATLPDISVSIVSTLAPSGLMPTGPPRSSSLLFSTTQRIRV